MEKRYFALSLLVPLFAAILFLSPLSVIASQTPQNVAEGAEQSTPDLLPPDINIFPDFLTETHATAPQITTDTFTIQNDGDADLTWSLTEDYSGAVCDAPSDIPWVMAEPMGSVLAPGGLYTLIVTYNSAGLTAGTYTGNFCIQSDDPDTALVAFPLTLTVVLPSAVTLETLGTTSTTPVVAGGAVLGMLLLGAAGVLLKRR